MNSTAHLDMEKCSVCSKMTASAYMSDKGWGRRVCRTCKQRQDNEDANKRRHRGATKGLLGWVLPALILAILGLWHYEADLPVVHAAFTAVSARLGMDSKDDQSEAASGAGLHESATAPMAAAANTASGSGAGQPLTLNLRSDVLFEFGNASLKAGAGNSLREVAKVIREHPGAFVVIRGYTDSIGSEQANATLSLQRAESVRDWMVKNGLPAKHLSVLGMGAKDPIAANTKTDGSDNPAGREQNRRVTISVSGS